MTSKAICKYKLFVADVQIGLSCPVQTFRMSRMGGAGNADLCTTLFSEYDVLIHCDIDKHQ
jgi:hypothetical protein